MAKRATKKSGPKGRPPKRTKASKNLAKYQYKLETLRKYVAGFDAKKLDGLYTRKPRTAAGVAARKKELARFNARYRQLRPYVDRAAKRVEPKGKNAAQKIEALREYAGLPKIKGLRAVPVEVIGKSARVSVDRAGRVSIKHGRVTEKMYRFDEKPRNGWVRASDGKRLTAREAGKLKKGDKRFLTAGEHAIEMLRAMLKKLPKNGQFVIVTSHHAVIPWSGDHGSIVKTLIDFVYQYEGKGVAPWLMPKILGVKQVATDMDGLFDYKREIMGMRSKAQLERKQRRRAQNEAAAFKLGKQSRRAKLTGKG